MLKWINCPRCGHKLFRVEDIHPKSWANINIKCNSCRALVDVMVAGEKDWEVVLK